VAVDDASDAVFRKFIAEVEKVTRPESRQFERCELLLLVDGMHIFDRLRLQDDFAVHNNVCSKAFIEYQSVKVDWQRNLTLHRTACLFQSPGNYSFINGF
jgi:hypothetical protein